jgi:RIO-like serine/threonine protein kinase
MFESLTLSDLPKQHCGILRKPSNTRPTIWVIEENGRRAAVKDYSASGYLYRNIVGRFLIRRERNAYRALEGLDGIPTFYRIIDGIALVIEEIPSENIELLRGKKEVAERFFRDLRSLVEEVHRHGLAHCDLKRAPNILLGKNGKPYIVDWSASISQRELRFFPLSLIYRRFVLDDLNAITKIQLRYCPEYVSTEMKMNYHHRSKAERLVRAIRDKARDLIQKIA